MTYQYGIVNAEDHLSPKQLMEIVNNTLTNAEQVKIINNSNLDEKHKNDDFADLSDLENMNESLSDDDELIEIDCAAKLFNNKIE